MTKQKFSKFVEQLRSLNPEAGIGSNSQTISTIWSEVPADQLTLPPYTVAVEGMPYLKFAGYQIQVKYPGE